MKQYYVVDIESGWYATASMLLMVPDKTDPDVLILQVKDEHLDQAQKQYKRKGFRLEPK